MPDDTPREIAPTNPSDEESKPTPREAISDSGAVPSQGPLDTPATPMDRILLAQPLENTEAFPYIGALLHCSGKPPRIQDVRAEVQRQLAAIPVLTAVADPARGSWMSTNGIELDRHVVERRAEPGQLHSVVGELLRTRLPDGAPLWQLWLISGYASDEYCLVFRVHHGLQDASGMLHTLETLFAAGHAPSSSSGYHGFASQPKCSLGDRYRALAASLRTMRRPDSWRLAGLPFSSTREYRWADIPRDVLKSTAQDHGGSCNDVYLAALAHVLSTWHADNAVSQAPPAEVPLLVAMNVRRPEEVGLPGNRTSFTMLRLPGDAVTLSERLAGTVSRTAQLKSARDREAQRRILHRLNPKAMRSFLGRAFSPEFAAPIASSVVLRHELAFRGDPVRHVEPIMCTHRGIPLSVMTLTYRDTMAACFTSDGALPGLDGLQHDWVTAARQGSV